MTYLFQARQLTTRRYYWTFSAHHACEDTITVTSASNTRDFLGDDHFMEVVELARTAGCQQQIRFKEAGMTSIPLQA